MAFMRVLIVLSAMLFMVAGFTSMPKSFLKSSALNSVKVIVSEDEPIENILRRFKRGVSQSGHLFELRYKEHWENAHDMRKRKAERSKLLAKIERTNDRYERKSDIGSEYTS